MGLFGGKAGGGGSQSSGGRSARHSSGWKTLSERLRAQESCRILDFGPTSARNINFITALGHSIYMANLVEDAARDEWFTKSEAGDKVYDVSRFLDQNLSFSGRAFDVVMLWDTLDYLPGAFVQPVVDRIFEVLHPGGQLLAFFHSKMTGEEIAFTRYHLTETEELDMQRAGAQPILQTFSNRQVETAFQKFARHKFFLAKDALREAIVTR